MSADPSIVVTGMGLVTALGHSVAESWSRVVRGESGIRPHSGAGGVGHAGTPAAEVVDLDIADSLLRIPKNRKFMGRSSLCCVRAAKEAHQSSGIGNSGIEEERIGIYIGSGETGLEYGEFFRALSYAWNQREDLDFKYLGGRASRLIDPYFSMRTLANIGVAFLSTELGAKGPGFNFVHSDTAAAIAISTAVEDLRAGRCDAAIAGGHDSLVHESAYLAYESAGLLSRLPADLAYRPFDVDRDGIVLGEGAAFVVLERHQDADRRGAVPRGAIAGFASGMAIADDREPKRSTDVVADVIRSALGSAEPAYVIAHGIGTPEGDRLESSVLRSVFSGSVPVTALKSQTGYVGAATAAVELVLGLAGLNTGIIPPIARHLRTDPDCGVDLVTSSPRSLEGRRGGVLCISSAWGGQVTALFGSCRGA